MANFNQKSVPSIAASKLTDSSDKQPIKPSISPQAIAFVINYRNSALL
ncbi:MAG TPA: hypothetical protein VE956_08845 [Nodularia sp. (in: cyanobacteria)]|nr:hypothetical protein [Nodularia sp. (in: cyanobacteria)]